MKLCTVRICENASSARAHRFGDAVLHAGARLAQAPPEDERRADDDRHDGERRRREPRMREREQDDAADEEQRLPRQLRDPGAHQRLQHREVGREAARQLAGAPLGEEARRQAHEVREHSSRSFAITRSAAT